MAARASRPSRSRAEGLRSRAVRIAALLLPVAALALLSTMFLLANRVNPDDAIPFAAVDVSERARDRQLTRPRFAGVSSRGTPFALTAERARPDAADPRRMSAQAPRLVLGTGEADRATVAAEAGEVDTGARTIALAGDVRIDTATGYALRTAAMEGTLGRLRVVAPGEVRGTGPLGRLRAGAMRIDEDAAGAVRLVFTGGVDLLYLPPT